MRRLFWKALLLVSWAFLFPLRLFGYGDDAYTLWSYREWALTVGASALASASGAAAAITQELPLPLMVVFIVGGLLVGFWIASVILEEWKKWAQRRAARAQGDDRPTYAHYGSGDIVVSGEQVKREDAVQPQPSRYREGETIHIADFVREVAEIESGQEVVRHWTFKNCRILGPAALFVHEPKRPKTFLDCRWTEGEEAFSVMRPEEYSGDAELVGLHHCLLLGCHFRNVQMVTSQETYDRYRSGEINL